MAGTEVAGVGVAADAVGGELAIDHAEGLGRGEASGVGGFCVDERLGVYLFDAEHIVIEV